MSMKLFRPQLETHINELHAKRGVAVQRATEMRREHGIGSAAFSIVWAAVERFTDRIIAAEKMLEQPDELGKTYEVEA